MHIRCFYVGENNSKIPHIKGVRKDVVEALKKLKIPLVNIDAKNENEITIDFAGANFKSVTES